MTHTKKAFHTTEFNFANQCTFLNTLFLEKVGGWNFFFHLFYRLHLKPSISPRILFFLLRKLKGPVQRPTEEPIKETIIEPRARSRGQTSHPIPTTSWSGATSFQSVRVPRCPPENPHWHTVWLHHVCLPDTTLDEAVRIPFTNNDHSPLQPTIPYRQSRGGWHVNWCWTGTYRPHFSASCSLQNTKSLEGSHVSSSGTTVGRDRKRHVSDEKGDKKEARQKERQKENQKEKTKHKVVKNKVGSFLPCVDLFFLNYVWFHSRLVRRTAVLPGRRFSVALLRSVLQDAASECSMCTDNCRI